MNDEFELSDRPYFVSDIQEYIKCNTYETLTGNQQEKNVLAKLKIE